MNTDLESIADKWGLIHREQAQLITAKADWHHPDVLAAGRTDVIGLTIGDTPELSSSISAVLPNTTASPAGMVRVGPTTSAELSASPEDAIVTPSIARNASTDRDLALLWSWSVTPKKPLDELVLTAHISVPIEGGASINTDIPLRIHVKRTVGFTLKQIFSNWATWSAIAAAAAGRAAWLHRKLRRERASSVAPDTPKVPAPQDDAADLAKDNSKATKSVPSDSG